MFKFIDDYIDRRIGRYIEANTVHQLQELDDKLSDCNERTDKINSDLQKIATALKGVYSLIQQIIDIGMKH